MPHYGAEPRATPTQPRLALDPAGCYSAEEVVKPFPSFLSNTDTPPKKKPNKNNQTKQRSKPPAGASEVLSWRRDSYRTNSESSDSSTHHRSSEFRNESEKHKKSDRNRINSTQKQSKPTEKPPHGPENGKFQIKTANKFDAIAVNEVENEATPVVHQNKPWFEKFEAQQPTKVTRRKPGNNES